MADRAYMPGTPKTVEHETPEWLFRPLCREFDLTVDAAATPINTKLTRYWTKAQDGLRQNWCGERVWANPPWLAEDLQVWTERAWREARLNGVTTVMLVPVKSDQKWWHLYALQAERRFIPGRVKFGAAKNAHPSPIAVLIFGPDVVPCGKTLARGDRKGVQQ